MKKMLRMFGYTNAALLIASTIIIMVYVDFQNPSTFDYVLITLYGITFLIHITRLILFILKRGD